MGNGSSGLRLKSASSVHPHVCGERIIHDNIVNHKPGSSPRVWGTDGGQRPPCYEARFIPTCVGNGEGGSCRLPSQSVHPHVCGERFENLIMVSQVDGSSPRVWGTDAHIMKCDLMFRFIPTCVGNGDGGQRPPCMFSVHPHVCGERKACTSQSRKRIGSSPRVWGTASDCAR